MAGFGATAACCTKQTWAHPVLSEGPLAGKTSCYRQSIAFDNQPASIFVAVLAVILLTIDRALVGRRLVVSSQPFR
ncbi:hypothetical protein SAMN05421858_4610 [Haladaptatus litoreus]|uniref:Uncharacterized protein n=1 Tax=Haladaptatus litoreus TaxID=553468 RepID=A0A1N7EXR1_9EURY|nr:hypothetical protein SAMN05421858_4610 [Haladaptatus litoreus]